ncbi:MAG: hypothetical protein AAF998_02845 [Bacteroidota bacterium]
MLNRIKTIIRQRRWKLYTAPYQLNIVGVRSPITSANQFDDLITVFYRDEKGKWRFHAYPATTDPGLPYLHVPIHNMGAAILAMGQYTDKYMIDRHRGRYYALCQRGGPVTVVRDYNRDSTLDYNNGERMTGNFGINIHRALATGETPTVERYSAGCQVFKNADDFNKFMRLCETHKKLHGNVFTYSLVDFRALRRANRRKWLLRGGLLGGAALVTLLAISTINND